MPSPGTEVIITEPERVRRYNEGADVPVVTTIAHVNGAQTQGRTEEGLFVWASQVERR